MDRRDQDYLGDGVYVAHDGYQLWIRANDADWGRPTVEVALEPNVVLRLIDYAMRVGLIENRKKDL